MMKLDTASLLADVRRTCQTIDRNVPRWALVLFAASLGALLLVELDRRFYSMGRFTPYYIHLNYVVVVATAAYIFFRYRAARRAGL